MNYVCQTIIFGTPLPTTSSSSQTITITTEEKVNKGQRFLVEMAISPGIKSGPVPINANTASATFHMAVTGGGTANGVLTYTQAIPAAIPPYSVMPVTLARFGITATGNAPEKINFAAGVIEFAVPSQQAVVKCSPSNTAAFATTRVIKDPVIPKTTIPTVAGSNNGNGNGAVSGNGSGNGGISGSGSGSGTGSIPLTGTNNSGLLAAFGLLMAFGGIIVMISTRRRVAL